MGSFARAGAREAARYAARTSGARRGSGSDGRRPTPSQWAHAGLPSHEDLLAAGAPALPDGWTYELSPLNDAAEALGTLHVRDPRERIVRAAPFDLRGVISALQPAVVASRLERITEQEIATAASLADRTSGAARRSGSAQRDQVLPPNPTTPFVVTFHADLVAHGAPALPNGWAYALGEGPDLVVVDAHGVQQQSSRIDTFNLTPPELARVAASMHERHPSRGVSQGAGSTGGVNWTLIMGVVVLVLWLVVR
ncbi:hypothetical protein [Cellulomonas humilata]|uniref:Uncharacterized protein n=1 Tax=Cellulomonas humilata TaxID=144055 RepID=A0ABU0EL12_9CELL|nr:hypothetical protein [Cellulomonas humilata]MDQ0375980.1 hypothetical protein [Cellulomonas humilata]